MDYRAYKDTNEKVSLLGMGCMRLPLGKDGKMVDFAKAESVIDRAVELGINYFDGGYFYQGGGSERAMGLALKKYSRNSFFMTTQNCLIPVSRTVMTFWACLRNNWNAAKRTILISTCIIMSGKRPATRSPENS